MQLSIKLVCLLVVLVSVSNAQQLTRKREGLGSLMSTLFGSIGGSNSDEQKPEAYEPEWTDFKTIQLNTGEKELSQRDLFDRVKQCIDECVKKLGSSRSFRDKCVQEVCDIY